MTMLERPNGLLDPMPPCNYETLSAQDVSFLAMEGPSLHMHIGVTMTFESGPLAKPGGGIDFAAIRGHIAKRLHLIPRYRQCLARGLAGEALWIDDERFDLDYHVRHVRLPAPGSDDMLKALCGRLMSLPLDRGRPLWEIWVVEGLTNDRFALVDKTHHCMIDGLSGVEVMRALLSLTTEGLDDSVRAARWVPRQAPKVLELLRDQLAKPLAAYRSATSELQEMRCHPRRTWQRALRSVTAVGQAAKAALRFAADTPFNRPIGQQRRLEWLTLDLAEVKEVKNRLGGTLNDTVLATVAGALGSFLGEERGETLLRDLRALVPVSVRNAEEQSALGNRVSAWMVDMPVTERNPRRRLAQLCRQTAQFRENECAQGLDIVSSLGTRTFSLAMYLMTWASPFNLVVTNVPGPQFPLYLLGARLVDVHPHVPLFTNQGLGIALFSYAGKLCWGFNADRDLVPDLAAFRGCVASAFAELLAVARENVKGRSRGPATFASATAG